MPPTVSFATAMMKQNVHGRRRFFLSTLRAIFLLVPPFVIGCFVACGWIGLPSSQTHHFSRTYLLTSEHLRSVSIETERPQAHARLTFFLESSSYVPPNRCFPCLQGARSSRVSFPRRLRVPPHSGSRGGHTSLTPGQIGFLPSTLSSRISLPPRPLNPRTLLSPLSIHSSVYAAERRLPGWRHKPQNILDFFFSDLRRPLRRTFQLSRNNLPHHLLAHLEELSDAQPADTIFDDSEILKDTANASLDLTDLKSNLMKNLQTVENNFGVGVALENIQELHKAVRDIENHVLEKEEAPQFPDTLPQCVGIWQLAYSSSFTTGSLGNWQICSDVSSLKPVNVYQQIHPIVSEIRLDNIIELHYPSLISKLAFFKPPLPTVIMCYNCTVEHGQQARLRISNTRIKVVPHSYLPGSSSTTTSTPPPSVGPGFANVARNPEVVAPPEKPASGIWGSVYEAGGSGNQKTPPYKAGVDSPLVSTVNSLLGKIIEKSTDVEKFLRGILPPVDIPYGTGNLPIGSHKDRSNVFDTIYVDDDIRITRSLRGEICIFRKLSSNNG